MNGKQQIKVFLVKLGAPNFPQPFTNGMDSVEFAIIITELALQIAFVRFPNGTQTSTQQTGTTSFRKFAVISYEQSSIFQSF
ncbi:hypothetical protein SDC9_142905 [bioreactor metagenome]|uniref:Uncharacterized protein n=1 Tax=bioreactor metagenome TaxID=1076179 RepID=A0A645E1W5_9ZZZZ